jgi:hypothetical protein
MMINEHEALEGMRTGRGNRSTRRKPVPMPSYPPYNPNDMTWDLTRPPMWNLPSISIKVWTPNHSALDSRNNPNTIRKDIREHTRTHTILPHMPSFFTVKMESAGSSKALVPSYQLHNITSQKPLLQHSCLPFTSYTWISQ